MKTLKEGADDFLNVNYGLLFRDVTPVKVIVGWADEVQPFNIFTSNVTSSLMSDLLVVKLFYGFEII